MGRENRDRDRKGSESKKSPGKFRFGRGFGKKAKRQRNEDFKRFRGFSNNWHNFEKDEELAALERRKKKTPPPPTAKARHGHFLVQREDGSTYEISKDWLKYTQTEPRLPYSIKPSTERKAIPETYPETPEKLLEQLTREEKHPLIKPDPEPKGFRNHSPPPPAATTNAASAATPIAPFREPKSPERKLKIKDVPSPKSKISINFNLAELQLPVEVMMDDKSDNRKETSFDIFGECHTNGSDKGTQKVKSEKCSPRKLSFLNNSLSQISSLYDDEDENDLVPTNALRIGSNQIKPVKSDHITKERREPKKEIAKKAPSPVPVPPPRVEVAVEPKRATLTTVPAELQPLDILKTLDTQSTEVDDFLQQIQEQRQRMEEKLSHTISPKKAPKFMSIIDIDSVQKEINEKLEQMPDDLMEMLPRTSDQRRREEEEDEHVSADSSSSEESSSSSSSEDDDDDEEDSTSNSSATSSETSSSSDSSESDEEESEVDASSDERDDVSISSKPLSALNVDLTLTTRSPVMLKIQPKPRVIPVLAALGDDEEHVQKQQAEEMNVQKDRNEGKEFERRERERRRHRKEDVGREKDGRSSRYGRQSSPRKLSRRRERREVREEEGILRDRGDSLRKKDRHRRSKSGGRKSWRRSRSNSLSPLPVGDLGRVRDRYDSRSRSRSLSADRGRKRSPWRPPIDFWENLNVPTTSWAYNDDQYFSRAYYDESYNYFEQNQIGQHCNSYENTTNAQDWSVGAPQSHHELSNGVAGGGNSSPMRGSLDDRINNVLNGVPTGQHQQQSGGAYNCYNNSNNNNSGYDEYNRPEPRYYNQYENRASGDQYRQTANLLSINCNEGYGSNSNDANEPATPFALQKGNVIEVVPSEVDANVARYQSEEKKNASSKSAQRKSIREKKRMEKKMRKKKLELELQSLLDGCPTIDINIDGEKRPSSPSREEVRKVIFSDGVLPGDGTSDSAVDTSEDSNIDLAELTSNQLKKYRKKKRKKKTTEKGNVNKVQELIPPVAVQVANEESVAAENGLVPVEVGKTEEQVDMSVPPPPPNDPPSHLVQPTLKREVLERPKKLLYFNTCHRERRMDFFSIFVPFSMFIRLNDPRLLQGHPAIVNRRRIPQPIYPPNMYPPPPQPFQHLPPVQISSGMSNSVVHPPPNEPQQHQQVMASNINAVPPPPSGPIRHIPTIGDN